MTATPATIARMPGQPIVVLVAVPVAWALLRVATFETALEGFPSGVSEPGRATATVVRRETIAPIIGSEPPQRQQGLLRILTSLPPRLTRELPLATSGQSSQLQATTAPPAPELQAWPLSRQLADQPVARVRPAASPILQTSQTNRRWSGDAWVLLREGSEQAQRAGPVLPLYGGSQAGAVLRYDLAPGSQFRPRAYLRAVHALDTRESDLAAGLSIRPLAAGSLTVHAEARASRRGRRVETRPAAFLTAGVDQYRLPLGASLRAYAQAGYVGGGDATAFADGSIVAERDMLRSREKTVSAGVGVWGGAQRGAARLDVGPSASVRFPLGEAGARITIDYRLRVAGNAEPAAGAALTLSAGF